MFRREKKCISDGLVEAHEKNSFEKSEQAAEAKQTK